MFKKLLLFAFCYLVLLGCKPSDEDYKAKALRICNQLNEKQITDFQDIGLTPRGTSMDVWHKNTAFVRATYNVIYIQDSTTIAVGYSPRNFCLDYPMSIPVDTAIYRNMTLELKNDSVKVSVQYPKITQNVFARKALFTKTDPFDKFKERTELKKELEIIKINSKGIGSKLEIYLSPLHILTYLPKGKDKEAGEQIAPNWFYKKLNQNSKLVE